MQYIKHEYHIWTNLMCNVSVIVYSTFLANSKNTGLLKKKNKQLLFIEGNQPVNSFHWLLQSYLLFILSIL